MTAFCLDKWDNWMAHALYPDAKVIRVDLDNDTPENILARHDGGIFLFHVACTFPKLFPNDRDGLVELLNQNNIQILNANVKDNSKNYLHTFLSANGLPDTTVTSREGDPSELLIVKSNFNNLAVRDVEAKKLHPTWNIPVPKPSSLVNYRVLMRAAIPDVCWNDNDYCIQKFVENKDGYMFRAIYHRGKMVVFFDKSKMRIKKIIANKNWTPTPTEETARVFDFTQQLANISGYDFFSVDIVMDDNGALYPVDINPTPAWSLRHDNSVIQALLV